MASVSLKVPRSIWKQREPVSQIGTLKMDNEAVGTVLVHFSFRPGSSRFDLNISQLVIDDDSEESTASADRSSRGSSSSLDQRLPISERIEIMEQFANAQCLSNSGSNRSFSASNDSSSSSQISTPNVGLVSLEVVAAQGLARESKWLRSNYQSNPFVVVSFGRQTFRTRTVKRNQNPVWRERIYLTVRESELSWEISLAVYGYDRLGPNNCLGKARLPLDFLMSQSTNQPCRVALALDPPPAQLLVRAVFTPYVILRKNFWTLMARQYDGDGRGKLNRIELAAMLESLGSTDQALNEFIGYLGQDDLDAEYPIASIVSALEQFKDLIVLEQCPVCQNALEDESDVITHVAVCAAKDTSGLDHSLMSGGFLTEEYASRKWWVRLLSFVSFGGYQLGRNNGHILVHDRLTGRLIEERIPFYIRLGIRLIYQSFGANRATDWRMVRHLLAVQTRRQGAKCDAPSSVAWIPSFIEYHQLRMDEVQVPAEGFRSFNEFFYRHLKPGARPISKSALVSPADCRLNVFASVEAARELWIKGRGFTVAKLLQDDQLGHYFANGPVAICRLAPQDYHRFHCPVDGRLLLHYTINGAYYTVNPMAVRTELDVFGENVRTVYLFDSPRAGKVAMVAVGAMMVGSIQTTATDGQDLRRGDEIGYFAFGGSTLILLLKPGVATWDADLLHNSHQSLETLVRMGMSLGTILE